MYTLVKNRPFKKRKTNNIKRKVKKIKLIYPEINFPIKRFWIFLLSMIFIYWIFFIIQHTIFKDENYIKKIYYSQMSINNYDDPYLYNTISKLLKDENFFVASKFKKKTILRTLKQEFPIVKNIKIIQAEKFSASVKVDFYDLDLVLKLWDRKFWVLWYYDFEIFSGNNIWNGAFSIELPQYLGDINSIHWLFVEISPEKLIHDMDIISQWFPAHTRIVYLPGSSMTVVFFWEKRVYLNNKNSLIDQIDSYNLLMKYYNNANSLKIIDLGSLEWDKIIVRE